MTTPSSTIISFDKLPTQQRLIATLKYFGKTHDDLGAIKYRPDYMIQMLLRVLYERIDAGTIDLLGLTDDQLKLRDTQYKQEIRRLMTKAKNQADDARRQAEAKRKAAAVAPVKHAAQAAELVSGSSGESPHE
jgi:hypothetical protein